MSCHFFVINELLWHQWKHSPCWATKDHILFTFYIPLVTLFLSYPSIKPLIFTTFIINMGLNYHFPNHLFLSLIWVNLWLIIEKNNIFSLYFKVRWVWWCLQVYLKTLTSSKVTTYPQIRILSSICGLISRRRSWKCGENISSNICWGFEGMSCRFVKDLKGWVVDLLRILRDKFRELWICNYGQLSSIHV